MFGTFTGGTAGVVGTYGDNEIGVFGVIVGLERIRILLHLMECKERRIACLNV